MDHPQVSTCLSLGEFFYLCRRRFGWSQSELASKAGVSRNEVSLIERGKANVTIDTVHKLALAFGLYAYWKFSRTEMEDGIALSGAQSLAAAASPQSAGSIPTGARP